jgi:lysophospholipid acyltransferase (LPLAT)-like uncharacterized protein
VTFKERLYSWLIDVLGKPVFWLWGRSTRMTVLGEGEYLKLRKAGKPVVILLWHGKILFAPYFFRGRNMMPLVSPSGDGEIVARLIHGWGYKVLRGSGSHFIKTAWVEMKRELEAGGELIIVADGPRGPDRRLKMGGVKLAAETGAALVPFSFSSKRKRTLRSWDSFLIIPPFSRVVAAYGPPVEVAGGMSAEELERERRRVEQILVEFDRATDRFFDRTARV